jgi:hypothetical protein
VPGRVLALHEFGGADVRGRASLGCCGAPNAKVATGACSGRPDGGFTASFAIRLGRGLVLLALSEETR